MERDVAAILARLPPFFRPSSCLMIGETDDFYQIVACILEGIKLYAINSEREGSGYVVLKTVEAASKKGKFDLILIGSGGEKRASVLKSNLAKGGIGLVFHL